MKIKNIVNEFAPANNPGGGNYLKALASAWYNDTFNTGDLHKGIKSQEDVERILERGIHCGDGKIRKYMIGYNHRFDGVDIQSEDHYEYSDHDDAGRDIDSRTGKPWGPYDVVEFSGNELDESISEARAASASFRQGNAQRGELNAMTPEERKAHEDKRAEQQRKRDDARLARERERNAAKKGVAEDRPIDRARQRVQSQGFTASPEERNADRLANRRRWEEKFDKIHSDFMNRGGVSGLYSDEEKAHQAQQRMARDEHETQRRRDNHDDDRATMDMFRDRLNRYQWSSQRDVDPEQLAAISNITYTPRERNKVKEANKFFKPGPATTGKFPEPRERKPGQAWSKSETLGKDGKIYHWQDPRAKQDVSEAMGEHEFKSANGPVSVTTEPGRTVVKRKEWDNSGSGSGSDSGTLNAPALGGTRKSDYDSGDYSDERSMDEAEQQKGADYRDPPEADYGDDYQAMVKRMKQLAGAGPLKTVYDPTKRVYKNMPTATQPGAKK